MKIFVDCHVFDGGFQGTRTYLKGLYAELIQDKTLEFFLGAQDVERLEKEFGVHQNVTYVAYPSGNKVKRLLLDLPKLLRKHKIDYAHFQYRVPPIKACKYIVTTHDVLFEDFPQYFPKIDRFLNKITFKISARMSEIVLTVSPYSKQEIAKHLGVFDALITPNGVEQLFFAPYDKSTLRKEVSDKYGLNRYLIYISRLEPRKNQHLLLKHFVGLQLYKTHELVFVGHETYANPMLDSLAESLSEEAKRRVKFLEHVAFEELLKLLRAADTFIYPSAAEGFGIPPLEAAAARVPVLCSSATAMSDFSFFGENLFNPDNEDEFASKLKRIAESIPDESKLAQISNQVAERYNWRDSANVLRSELKRRA